MISRVIGLWMKWEFAAFWGFLAATVAGTLLSTNGYGFWWIIAAILGPLGWMWLALRVRRRLMAGRAATPKT